MGTFGSLFFIHMTSTPVADFNQNPELLAVNSILGCIGQAPVTALEFENPEVYLVYQLLNNVRIDTLSEGWNINAEEGITLSPLESDGRVYAPSGTLRIDGTGESIDRTTNIVVRDGALYDKNKHDYCSEPVQVNVVWDIEYDNLPAVFQRYITARASTRAAVELVNNSDLYKMLGQNEVALRAALVDYECTSGDYTFFGSPQGTVYRPYSPYRALAR